MVRNILNLIRWKNILMIVLAQCLIKFTFFEPFGVNMSLTNIEFLMLVLATICIASAGNIINDIYDVETDFINRPDKLIIGKSISEKTAYNLFISLNVLGVGIGYYVSHAIGKSELFSIFVIISALLYVYASFLKQSFLIGNIIVSALVAFSIIIVGIFELIPNLTSSNQDIQFTFFKILIDYALLAFIINLLREIAKDIEDFDGDLKTGMHTLPIVIGKDYAIKVLFILSIIPLVLIIVYINKTLYKHLFAVGYFLVFIIGPLMYNSIKILSAKTKKDFNHISNVFKLIMFFGMLSIVLYKLILF